MKTKPRSWLNADDIIMYWASNIHFFIHISAHFFSGKSCGGSSPRTTRNTSWPTAISDSSVGSAPRSS